MKAKSIKSNFIFNALRVLSTAVIGIIMMPYVNKTLGVVSLGKVEYIYSIVNYVLLLAALGIPVYGVREIAKVRNNTYERTKTVVELLIILAVTSLISYGILFGIYFFIPQVAAYKDLLIVLSSMLFLTNMGADWFFLGMENQKFITIRVFCVRVITLLLLFLLVKTPDDYLWYALILVLNLCGANIFNFFYLLKQIDLKLIKRKHLNFKKHFKPITTIFVATISMNIYLYLDVILLGSLAGDKYVGLYVAANKLVRFVITFVTIIGTVLLPRLTTLFVEDTPAYYLYLKKAFNFIVIISLPASIYIYFFAYEIMFYMAGTEFLEAQITLELLAPLCVVVGLAYFFGYLVFYVQNQEKIYTTAVVFSAVISLLLNLFLIKTYQHNATAFVAVLVEVLAVIYMIFRAKKCLGNHRFLTSNFYKIIGVNVFIAFILWLGLYHLERNLSNILLLVVVTVLAYVLLLWRFKETTTTTMLSNFKKIIS